MSKDIKFIALVKGEERYVFLYNDPNTAEVLKTFGKFAANKDLSFTWYDAAVLCQNVRQESKNLEAKANHITKISINPKLDLPPKYDTFE